MFSSFFTPLCAAFTFLSTVELSVAQPQAARDSIKNIALQSVTAIGIAQAPNRAITISPEKLQHIQSSTLGETLSHIPGIQNSSFGPHAGAPVIRSLSGNRVKIVANGLALNDLSGISPNINVQVDMDNLLGMDVYKGSASVLFGGKAIGGAVNLKDNSIPTSISPKKWQGKVVAEAGANAGSRQALDVQGNDGKHWAWHIGGMNQANGDLKIPGNTKAPIAYDPSIDHLTQVLAQVYVDKEITRNLSLYPYISQFVLDNLDNPSWGLTAADLYTSENYSVIGGVVVPNPKNDLYIPGQDPNTPFYTEVVKGITDYAPVQKGIMPNSHAQSRSINLGTSFFGDNYHIGLGYRGMEGYFGIPGFALSTKPKHTHEPIAQPLQYDPINTRSRSNSLLFASSIMLENTVISKITLDYMAQFADDRELIGIYRLNKFNSTRHALRTEITQQTWKFLSGTTGIDALYNTMLGDGLMRYLPNNSRQEIGLFTLQEIKLSPLSLRLGYRHDWVTRKAMPDETYKRSRGLAGGNLSLRDFELNQYSADLHYTIGRIAFLQASYSHAERAPEVNELYAGNDHFAIMIEENGDDRLNKEVSRSYELGGGISFHGLRLSATYYRSVFTDYLYLAHTGISRSGGFLVKEWRASDTEINGWEAELAFQHSWQKDYAIEITSYADLVKNKNIADDSMRQWAEGDFMPNLPTSRYGFSSNAQLRKINLQLSFDRYLEQRYLGKNINPEPPMPAFTLLSARFGYMLHIAGLLTECYLFGNNLLDVEARPQQSFLKYLAPLPGRNISLGLKATI